MKAVLVVASVAIMTAGCASNSTSSPSLSQAFCNDLKSGMSPFAIYNSMSDKPTPKEFADKAYGMAAVSCPEQLKSNQALRQFLTNWKINPDV